MNNIINNRNNIKLVSWLVASLVFLAASCFGLPSTGPTNLQTTPDVAFQTVGSTLSFTAPDKSVINWNNFGSGTDAIALGDVISYKLPSSTSSVLNVVSGANTTTINGAIESNAHVYILNPNGIILGSGSRIDASKLTLSTVDSPFSGQFSYLNNGKLPSESGTRTSAGSVSINGGASNSNITILTKDITVSSFYSSASTSILADGNVVIGGSGNMVYNVKSISVSNPTGNTTIGVSGGSIIAGEISVQNGTGSVSVGNGSNISSPTIVLNSVSGDINASNLTSSSVTASGKNVSIGLSSVANPTVSITANGTVSLTSPSSLFLSSLKNESGASTVNVSGKLTLGNIHVNSGLATSFTGQSIADSVNDVFVYGPTSFAATAGDISVTKANHSFGPLTTIATGDITVFENAGINLNSARGVNLNFKTNAFLSQTPSTASLIASKLSIVGSSHVLMYTGTISNGLTINTLGNVDIGRFSLSTNLNNVTPVIIATGYVTNPSP